MAITGDLHEEGNDDAGLPEEGNSYDDLCMNFGRGSQIATNITNTTIFENFHQTLK